MMQYSQPVEQSIERLCHKGCRSVWHDIAALEQGRVLDETRGLRPDEVLQVVAELKQIMAVYLGSCRPD